MNTARATRTLLPPLFFLAWAIIFTYPLVLHMGHHVILERGGDAWLHLWDLWWADKSLAGLHQSPFHSAYIYYPNGVDLYYHSLDLTNGVVSIPLQHLLGLTPSFNVLLLANLTLDGLAMYWLCLERTQSLLASLVGGALFASTPLLATSVNLGQLDEATAWWIPLYVLAIWRALDSPGEAWQRGGGRRAVLAAALCLLGASLATWYFTAGLAIFTAVFVPAYLLSKREDRGRASLREWRSAIVKLAGAALLFVVIMSPILWPMIRERLKGETYMFPSLSTTIYNSADLAAFFLPPRVQIPEISKQGGNASLGYVAIALALVALVTRWRKLWPLGLALAAVLLMALGPELQAFGADTGFPMPYALLNNVPFVGASRQPLRFVATAAMVLSLLAAFGALWLLSRLAASAVRRAVVPLLAILIALELFALPRPLASTDVSSAFKMILDRPEQGGVMELPVDVWAPGAMLDATVHERPIVGGYTSRHFPYPLAQSPVPGVSELYYADPAPFTAPDILTPTVKETGLSALDYYGIRFLVVHKADIAGPPYNKLQPVLSALFEPSDVVFDDQDLTVYRTPSAPATAPLVGLGEGWYDAEQGDGGPHRWTDGNALVWIGLPRGNDGNYSLKLTAYAYGSPRTLVVTVDGREVLRKQVGTGFESVVAELGNLGVGEHEVRLRSVEPAVRPPGDNRNISLGFMQVALERAP